jgi:hypothetical protein
MTTHDEPTKATTTTNADADSPSRPEFSSAGTEPETARPDQAAAAEPSSETIIEPSQMGNGPSNADTEESRTSSLFAEDPSGLRSRWDEVQAAFVDDPKECVQKADTLVSEVVEQLTNGFSEARARLEAQWGRGEEASTEDLRLALKRYRDFFQRLLSV